MSGRLGVADLSAGVDTQVYQVPDGMVATVTVSMCVRGTGCYVRLALAAAAAPAAPEYVEYEASVPSAGVLERTGLVLSAGERVIARASTTGVSVRVHGFEEDA